MTLEQELRQAALDCVDPKIVGSGCANRTVSRLLIRAADTLAARPEELQWKLHRDEDGSLGSFLTGRPGEAIYAIDERKPGPYRVWTLDLPELPPMNDERS